MNEYRCQTCYNAKCIWNHENPHAYSGCFPHRHLTFASYWANNFMEKVGCASHIGLKREKMLDELVKATKMRIRQLFLDDSKCELCEKIDEADGYDGQNEGCEKGLCIECAIDKALREFAEEIRQQRGE
jgi:hypothetical protein